MAKNSEILSQIAYLFKDTFYFEFDGNDTLILTNHSLYSKIKINGRTLELFENPNHTYLRRPNGRQIPFPHSINLKDPEWLSLVSEALLIYD